MGNVFANGKEVSGKAQGNKSLAAMPSVCLSPPSPPAGPIPIPYPVTSTASDTADGTGSVKIKGKETGKKNGSVYSKCNGNQPATRSFGMDVVSHTLEGKTKFEAYSFDVFFEKGGAERFMDLTTSNHMNPATAVTPSGATPAAGATSDPDCVKMRAQNRTDFRAAKAKAQSKKAARFSRVKEDDQPGITIAQATGPGGATFSGTSSAAVRELVPRFSAPPNRPLKKEQRVKRKKKKYGPYKMDICPPKGEIDYRHPGGMEHAEIHIFNSVAGLGGPGRPKLTFGIEWRESYDGKLKEVRRDACPVCQHAIQHACACFSIYICDSKGQPQPQCPQDKPAPPADPPI